MKNLFSINGTISNFLVEETKDRVDHFEELENDFIKNKKTRKFPSYVFINCKVKEYTINCEYVKHDLYFDKYKAGDKVFISGYFSEKDYSLISDFVCKELENDEYTYFRASGSIEKINYTNNEISELSILFFDKTNKKGFNSFSLEKFQNIKTYKNLNCFDNVMIIGEFTKDELGETRFFIANIVEIVFNIDGLPYYVVRAMNSNKKYCYDNSNGYEDFKFYLYILENKMKKLCSN